MTAPLRAAAVGLACFLAGAPVAGAQELEPRVFSPGPTGLSLGVLSTAYSSGALVFDSSVPLEGVTAETWSGAIGYQRFFGLAGRTAKVSAVTAVADSIAKGRAYGQAGQRRFNGLVDPRVGLSIIFAGAPAMTPAEYARYRPRLLAGFSASVSAPLGQYDDDRLFNLGSNRWSLKTQLGLLSFRGPWTMEATVGGQFFTSNDHFLGDMKQTQAPITSVQAHLTRTFRRQLWVGASGTFYRGGRTSVDGVRGPAFVSNSRYGVCASVPLRGGQSLLLNFSSGLATRTGSDFNTFSVAWAVRRLDRQRP